MNKQNEAPETVRSSSGTSNYNLLNLIQNTTSEKCRQVFASDPEMNASNDLRAQLSSGYPTATKQNQYSQKKQAKIDRKHHDYAKFCSLIALESWDITPRERKWMRDKSVKYLAFMLAFEDCYTNFRTHGIRQGNHSPDEWEAWLFSVTEEERDAEAARIFVKVVTEISPWLNEQHGRSEWKNC